MCICVSVSYIYIDVHACKCGTRVTWCAYAVRGQPQVSGLPSLLLETGSLAGCFSTQQASWPVSFWEFTVSASQLDLGTPGLQEYAIKSDLTQVLRIQTQILQALFPRPLSPQFSNSGWVFPVSYNSLETPGGVSPR